MKQDGRTRTRAASPTPNYRLCDLPSGRGQRPHPLDLYSLERQAAGIERGALGPRPGRLSRFLRFWLGRLTEVMR